MSKRSMTTQAPRARRGALSVAGLALAVTLAGCGAAGGEDTTSPTASHSASATAVPTDSTAGTPSASTSETADPGPADDGSMTAADLPATPLETTGYTGEPRPVDEVYQVACLEALAPGEEIPETEGTGTDENGELQVTPWSLRSGQALTEGWTYCPTEMMGGMAIPATFEVTADADAGQVTGLSIADSAGQPVGGLRAEVSGGAPEGAEVVEVVEIEERPDYVGAGDEAVYLRSLVVEAESGTQLMVDLVSAPAGTDPESLDVWDLGVHDGSSRTVVYGTIPLESAGAAQEAADSELHAVLREMVGSYQPSVQ